MALDPLLTHCRLAHGRLVDIGIAGGRIATIGEDSAPSPSNRVPILDIDGDLVLPGLVDGHMHLDKTLMGLPWMPHPKIASEVPAARVVRVVCGPDIAIEHIEASLRLSPRARGGIPSV
jgi:cytosine/adenosine deaminase-related metal-dependent hydrolase